MMTDTSEPLLLLLQVLSPGVVPGERHALLNRLTEVDWAGLVAQAQRQNVAALLYLKLQDLPDQHTCPPTLLEVLRNAYLSNAGRNTLTLHSAGLLLQSLSEANLDVIGLKGIYLLENVYGDIGARSMNDVDILVHKRDLGQVIDTLTGLGYQSLTYFDLKDPNIDIKHLPPMTKPGFPPVEVHWTLLEEDEPFTIDAEALWQRALPARMADVDAKTLGVEDLVAHLCLHLTYQHYLILGLRGLVDIALVIHQHQGKIDWPTLVEISRSWQAEKVVGLTLALVSDLLGVQVPPEVKQGLLNEPISSEILEQARAQLLSRQRHEDYLTPDLVELTRKNSLFGKAKLGLSRVFLPRLTLARVYGVPPNSPRILGCYFRRLRDLVRQYGKTVRKIGVGDKTLNSALVDGQMSDELHAWMSR